MPGERKRCQWNKQSLPSQFLENLYLYNRKLSNGSHYITIEFLRVSSIDLINCFHLSQKDKLFGIPSILFFKQDKVGSRKTPCTRIYAGSDFFTLLSGKVSPAGIVKSNILFQY